MAASQWALGLVLDDAAAQALPQFEPQAVSGAGVDALRLPADGPLHAKTDTRARLLT